MNGRGLSLIVRQTLSLGYMQGLVGYRQLHTLISVGLIPGALYLMFFLVGGRELSQHVLFGTLIVQAVGAGVVSLPQQVVLHRMTRLMEMYIASPVGPVQYMLGIAIGRALFMIPGTLLLLTILIGFGFMSIASLPLTLCVIAAAFLTGSMLGFTIATHTTSIYATSAVANMLNTLLMMLPPVLYPLSVIPQHLRWIAFLAPTTVLAELVRVINGVSEATAGVQVAYWLLVGGWIAVCLLVVVPRSRWREA